MAGNSSVKLAGYPLGVSLPLLAPIGVWLGIPWLALLVVFGLLPVLGLLVGEDHSLPIVGLRHARTGGLSGLPSSDLRLGLDDEPGLGSDLRCAHGSERL